MRRDSSTDNKEYKTAQKAQSGRLASLRNARTFTSLKVRAFRLYLGSQVFEVMGMTIMGMARSLLAYRLTGSTAIIGIIALSQAIPSLLVILFGGAIADRFQKKNIMLVSAIAWAFVSLFTAVALVTGYLSADNEGSWWVLVVGAVVFGIIVGIQAPSRVSIIPEFVGEERLLNATSLISFGASSMRLLMPVAIGFLIDAFDFHAAYFSMAAVYSISSIFIYRFPAGSKADTSNVNTLSLIRDGFSYVRQQRTILIILLVTLIAGFLSRPYIQLLPVFTEDILKVGASELGILMSVSGAGAVAGALLLASLPNKKRGLMLLLSILISGMSLVAFSASTSYPLSLIIIIFAGIGEVGGMSLSIALIQYYVVSEYRGRVMSISQLQMGLFSLGTFIAGLMAESIGVQWTIGGFAALLVLIVMLVLAFIPQVRRLD